MAIINDCISIDVTPREYFKSCSLLEKNELIRLLVRNNLIEEEVIKFRRSLNECEFEDMVNKLRGRYLDLSEEEIKTINKITSRF